MSFIKKIVSSRLGQVLFLLHFVLFAFCLVTLRGLGTMEEYESHYLRYLFTVIVAFDYLIFKPLDELANYFNIKTTLFIQSLMGLIASFQWWMIGFIFESFLRFLRRKL